MYVIMCYINEVLIARVILGHHFTFADSALHVQNVDYVAQVRSKHVGVSCSRPWPRGNTLWTPSSS